MVLTVVQFLKKKLVKRMGRAMVLCPHPHTPPQTATVFMVLSLGYQQSVIKYTHCECLCFMRRGAFVNYRVKLTMTNNILL